MFGRLGIAGAFELVARSPVVNRRGLDGTLEFAARDRIGTAWALDIAN